MILFPKTVPSSYDTRWLGAAIIDTLEQIVKDGFTAGDVACPHVCRVHSRRYRGLTLLLCTGCNKALDREYRMLNAILIPA